MTEANPLIARPKDTTTGVTGIGIAESAQGLAHGVSNGDWVEAGLSAAGVGLEVLSLVVDPLGTLASYGVSWLIEHVRPLKEALDWFAGDPPVIQSFSETWANVAREVNEVAAELANEAKAGTSGWAGAAADVYRGHAAEAADAIAGASTLADGISTGVMVMGEVVAFVREFVRDMVGELVGRLIVWALEVAATLGLGTPAVVAQATAAISRAVSKVADLVRRLVKTISNVAPRIKKVIAKLDEIIAKLAKLMRKDDGGSTAPSAARTAPSSAADAPTPHGASPNSTTTPSSTPDTTSPSSSQSTTTPSSTSPTTRPDGSTTPDSTPTPRADNSPTSPSSSRRGDPAGRPLRDDAQNPRDRAQPPDRRCEGREPVDLATGEMYLAQQDVALPGTLPLLIGRVHVSSYRSGRAFGPSWTSTVDQRLEVDEHGVCYADPDGVILVYPIPPVAGEVMPLEGARWPLARRSDGGYTVTQPAAGRTLHFAPATSGTAVLLAITDRNGNRIDFEYTGTLSRVRHSGGYRVDVDSTDGLVTGLRLHNPTGDDIVLAGYEYDDDRRLVAVINSSGRALRFEYDHAGRITKWIDRNGEWYGYTYDNKGRCIRTDGSGRFFAGTVEYDEAERVTRETDSLGHITSHHFNEHNQLTRRVDPLGNETRFRWDPYDHLLAETDPLGRTTSYTRDELGNLTGITRPDGTRGMVQYTELALPMVRIDPDGAVWRNEFDARGNLVATTDPAGAVTRLEYGPAGNLTAAVDVLGKRTEVETNAAGLVVAVTDAGNATTRYERDQFGRVHTIVDPLGRHTTLTWTIEGKPRSVTYPDGARESWRYDGEGNAVEHVDTAGQVTRTEYTHFDVPAKRLAPDGTSILFGYDSELRLTSITNEQGQVWRYDYDPVGNLVREADFHGRVRRYVRDAAGQVVAREDAEGQRVTFTWDALGRMVERSCGPAVSRFGYDATGRLVDASNAHARTRLHRDLLGRVIVETTNGRTVTSRYDAAGRLVHRRTATGAESGWDYDDAGRPAALRSGSHTVLFDHDPAGRELSRIVDAGLVVAQTWDDSDRPMTQTVSALGGTPSAAALRIAHRRYRYRVDGFLRGVQDDTTGDRAFGLSATGRVVSVAGRGWQERYGYDQVGNLVMVEVPAGDPDHQGSRDYSGPLVRRAGRTRYDYDPRGRLVVRRRQRLSGRVDVWRYVWNADDRLVEAVTPDGTRWRYTYDALGRRIAKERLGQDGTAVERLDFCWAETVMVEQIHTSGTAITWDYELPSLRPVTQRERLPVRNAPQEWVDSKFYSIVSDLVGMPTELVDHNAELAWQARSTVWGELRTTRSARADIPLRFPGQYFDGETGLHYNFARYYDPETGRYQSDDPLGLASGPNPRAYVPNPTRYVDPLGLTVGPGGQHPGGTGPRPILSDGAMLHAWDQHRWGGGYHQEAQELRGQAYMAPNRTAEQEFMREHDRLMQNVLRQDMTYSEFSDRLRQAVDAHGDQPLIPRSASDPREGGGYVDHSYGDDVVVGANGQNGFRLAFGGEGGLRSAFPRFFR